MQQAPGGLLSQRETFTVYISLLLVICAPQAALAALAREDPSIIMAFVPGKLARRTTGGVSRRNSALAPWLLVASLLHCLLDRRTQAQSVSGVRSTYNVYDPAGHDYELAGLYCATWDSDQSYAWRSEYKWTAYCAGGGPSMGQSLCGQCLQVQY